MALCLPMLLCILLSWLPEQVLDTHSSSCCVMQAQGLKAWQPLHTYSTANGAGCKSPTGVVRNRSALILCVSVLARANTLSTALRPAERSTLFICWRVCADL